MNPLKNSFARTGILADPAHPDELPIGFARTSGRRSPYRKWA